MKRTKIVSAVLTATMILSLSVGCSGNKQKNEATPGGSEPKAAEKIKLSIARGVNEPTDGKNTIIEQELEKKYPDLDLEAIVFENASWKDQISTRIAGGQVPDIIWLAGRDDVEKFNKQGVLAEIKLEDIKKYMPKYFKVYEKYGTDHFLLGMIEGKNYAIPMVNPAMQRANTSGWRQDWLDNVGITKVPQTLAEFEDALLKFRNNDPDKNGKKDTYGMTARGKDSNGELFSEFYGAYGVFPTGFMVKDGKITYGGVTEEAKSAITMLNKWYKEELIDPEFVVESAQTQTQKWANSKVGYVSSTWYRLVPAVKYFSGEHYEALNKVNPNAKIALADAPVGPNGKHGYSVMGGKITGGIVMGAQMGKDPKKMTRALQLVDDLSADDETYALAAYGIKDTNWKLDSNGNVVDIPPFDKPEGRVNLGRSIFSGLNNPDGLYFKKEPADLIKKAMDRNIIPNQDYFMNDLLTVMPAGSMDKYNQLKLIQTKWVIDFVTGTKPISDFDKFVKEWNDNGGKQLVDDANASYIKWNDTIKTINAAVK